MPAIDAKKGGRLLRGLAVPALLWALVIISLREPLLFWLGGEQRYDQSALREWIKEARVGRQTLPEMVESYLTQVQTCRDLGQRAVPPPTVEVAKAQQRLAIEREKIEVHLESLGNAVSKMYSGLLPLFPTVYYMQVRFQDEPGAESIAWDSQLPHQAAQYQEFEFDLHPRARIYLQYQLHAYHRQQHIEQAAVERQRWVLALAVAGTALALLWMYLAQRRRQERERQRIQTQSQIDQAERLLLEEELRRREAEGRHEDAERKLLEQRLATQAAEAQALELKSQLYASIGIMAGSYAHNIKNLLVRPNDLLRRCLEGNGLSSHQEQMLGEVRETLGTVTERLQQILRTVRRDPSRSELTRIDLNDLLRDLHRTWLDLAREKWKLTLHLDLHGEPLWIEGDLSHLQQAVENLLFNARDATFEMRTQLRERAHRADDLEAQDRRQALIAAAAWKGDVVLRTRRDGDHAVLEVQDNGIGMTEDVRRRCTETHFSTKRDNAIYEGNSTGMGLGLSFVVVILEHHRATLDIESRPLQGTTFRVRFPAN